MINQYKRTDVFKCRHHTHAKFENRLSVFHVLRKRKCWPQGCVYFKWHCSLLNKGKKCIRGYRYTGRNCKGCSYFEDIKVNYQPELMLTPEEATAFWQDLEDFEEWIADNEKVDMDILANILSVKPFFYKAVSRKHSCFRHRGFLIVFKDGFIGRTAIDDFFYAHVSETWQKRHGFSAGDQVEFRGAFSLDQGRIVFEKMYRLEFNRKGAAPPVFTDDMLVAQQTATRFSYQNTACLKCPHGVLVDVTDERGEQRDFYRELYCLKGVQDPHFCIEHVNLSEQNTTELA